MSCASLGEMEDTRPLSLLDVTASHPLFAKVPTNGPAQRAHVPQQHALPSQVRTVAVTQIEVAIGLSITFGLDKG